MTKNTRLTAILLLLVMLSALLTLPISAAYPKATDNIADEMKVLTESTIHQLKKTNATLLSKTGTEVAVCIVKTTGGTPISEYARALYTEWKLGEGILILAAVDDGNYYLLQSTGVEDKVTNSVLTSIRDEYMEESFADGDIDRAVFRTASKIANFLQANVNLIPSEEDAPVEDKTPDAGEAETEAKPDEKKGTTAGSVIVGFLKFVLILALIALVAFVILFVVALFNDDAALLLQRTVFRKKSAPPVQTYYDERLYGNRPRGTGGNAPQRRPSNGNRPAARPNPNNGGSRPNPNRRPTGQNPGQAPRNPAYSNADGMPRRTGNPAPQRPRHDAMENADETRAFRIPQNRR